MNPNGVPISASASSAPTTPYDQRSPRRLLPPVRLGVFLGTNEPRTTVPHVPAGDRDIMAALLKPPTASADQSTLEWSMQVCFVCRTSVVPAEVTAI